MQLKRSLTSALRLLATLGILLTGVFSTVAIADASPTAQESANGGSWSMGIGASIEDGDPPASIFGAQFTVTSEDGDYIGGCTLEQPERVVPWWNCRVDVPSDRISLVWEDPDSIPAGYAPVENPIVFDPTTHETGPHNIGAFFRNVPVNGSTSTGSSATTSSTTSSETTSTTPFTIRATSCDNAKGGCWDEVGAHFTVTTEDGESVGECTLEASSGTDPASCSVPVPVGIVVVVTEDVSTITRGLAPESNPIRFDTGVEPARDCGYCHWGPSFVHGPKSETTSAAGATNTEELVIWAEPTDVGAQFTVSTETGEYIGECTLKGPVTGRTYCRIPVPVGIVVVVTEDVSTIASGLAPESNPIRFDTGVEPYSQCAPCHWGPDFRNGPKSTSTDTISSGTDTSSSAGTPVTSSTSDSTNTWFAPVVVWICEDPAASVLQCRGEAGIKVDIYLASGELVGSCTTDDPMATPWGKASYCVVKGLPFNADFVAKQDPSTIPAGYAPVQDTLELHVDSVDPVGFESIAFGFRNDRTKGASNPGVPAGSSGASSSNASSQATILMTFRGCPDGFDPTVGDFFAECTIPLDAPDASIIVWGGDGQGGMNITGLDRQDNGAYIYSAGPSTMNLQLSGLAPVLRDAYQVVGSDGVNGDTYIVNLANGETREVFVFYYYQ